MATQTNPAERWALPVQQARSRVTREKILAAAEQVFAERGYDGARIADIAKVAGCSVGAIYFRFKDKDALFFAIAETFAQEARGRFGDLLDLAASDGPPAAVRHYVLRTAAGFRRHRGLFRTIVEHGFEHGRAMRMMMAFRDEAAGVLEQIVGAELKRRGRDPQLAVQVMTQMVYGFLLTGIMNKRAPTRIDDARAIAELADAVACYLEGGA